MIIKDSVNSLESYLIRICKNSLRDFYPKITSISSQFYGSRMYNCKFQQNPTDNAAIFFWAIKSAISNEIERLIKVPRKNFHECCENLTRSHRLVYHHMAQPKAVLGQIVADLLILIKYCCQNNTFIGRSITFCALLCLFISFWWCDKNKKLLSNLKTSYHLMSDPKLIWIQFLLWNRNSNVLFQEQRYLFRAIRK